MSTPEEPTACFVSDNNDFGENCYTYLSQAVNEWVMAQGDTSQLPYLPIESWDTSRVRNFDNLFCAEYECIQRCEQDSEEYSCVPWECMEDNNPDDCISDFLMKKANTKANISNWDTSGATSMRDMFRGAKRFDAAISTWNVSNVDIFGGMFRGASSFNQALSDWDVNPGAVDYQLDYMFANATAFDTDISTWSTAKVASMAFMFFNATAFNADISAWSTSTVTTMTGMFDMASAFNIDISRWDTAAMNYSDDFDSMFDGTTSLNDCSKEAIANSFSYDFCAAYKTAASPDNAKVSSASPNNACINASSNAEYCSSSLDGVLCYKVPTAAPTSAAPTTAAPTPLPTSANESDSGDSFSQGSGGFFDSFAGNNDDQNSQTLIRCVNISSELPSDALDIEFFFPGCAIYADGLPDGVVTGCGSPVTSLTEAEEPVFIRLFREIFRQPKPESFDGDFHNGRLLQANAPSESGSIPTNTTFSSGTVPSGMVPSGSASAQAGWSGAVIHCPAPPSCATASQSYCSCSVVRACCGSPFVKTSPPETPPPVPSPPSAVVPRVIEQAAEVGGVIAATAYVASAAVVGGVGSAPVALASIQQAGSVAMLSLPRGSVTEEFNGFFSSFSRVRRE